MNPLDRYVARLVDRLDADDREEEPDYERWGTYPVGDQVSVVWNMADRIAALSNDTVPGYRALVYGPAPDLERPPWLTDAAVLRDKLTRSFEGWVAPRVELFRRPVGARGVADLLTIVDRPELPYVTRHEPHGLWTVRIRTGTGRRTATRAELVALCGARRRRSDPVGGLDVRDGSHRGLGRKLVVTNVGTVALRDVRLDMPEVSWCSILQVGEDGRLADELLPSESITKLMSVRSRAGDESFRLEVRGTSEDGETVRAFHRVTIYG